MLAGVVLVAAGCRREAPGPVAADPARRTPAEWRRLLDPEAYHVLREGGTETSFGPAYEAFKKHGEGEYLCAGCGAPLFTSAERFDSESGWPAFFDLFDGSRAELRESSGYMMPQEVACAACGGHLGHLFVGEGYPTPTDKRFCINAVAIRFQARPAAAQAGAPGKPARSAASSAASPGAPN